MSRSSLHVAFHNINDDSLKQLVHMNGGKVTSRKTPKTQIVVVEKKSGVKTSPPEITKAELKEKLKRTTPDVKKLFKAGRNGILQTSMSHKFSLKKLVRVVFYVPKTKSYIFVALTRSLKETTSLTLFESKQKSGKLNLTTFVHFAETKKSPKSLEVPDASTLKRMLSKTLKVASKDLQVLRV